MAWVKLDDQFADHPKVIQAGPLAGWLYICGLTYCSRLLTDGFIPSGQVRRLADLKNADALAQRLVQVGLWEACEGGFRVPGHGSTYLLCAPPTDQELRRSGEYKAWRRAVLTRDGHSCMACGSLDDIQAHHIQPWATAPDLRFDVANGIALCAPCHREVHRKATS